jgi:hypothetical protein
MIKPCKSNKLRLNNETVRTLQSLELKTVSGGRLNYNSKSCDAMNCASDTTV